MDAPSASGGLARAVLGGNRGGGGEGEGGGGSGGGCGGGESGNGGGGKRCSAFDLRSSERSSF
jgi:type III secretion protein J